MTPCKTELESVLQNTCEMCHRCFICSIKTAYELEKRLFTVCGTEINRDLGKRRRNPRSTACHRICGFRRVFAVVSGRFSPLSRTVFVAVELPGRIEQEYVAHIVAHSHGELCHKSALCLMNRVPQISTHFVRFLGSRKPWLVPAFGVAGDRLRRRSLTVQCRAGTLRRLGSTTV